MSGIIKDNFKLPEFKYRITVIPCEAENDS